MIPQNFLTFERPFFYFGEFAMHARSPGTLEAKIDTGRETMPLIKTGSQKEATFALALQFAVVEVSSQRPSHRDLNFWEMSEFTLFSG